VNMEGGLPPMRRTTRLVADDSHRESRRDGVEIPSLTPPIRLCPSHGD
jgi:hypothetical protein